MKFSSARTLVLGTLFATCTLVASATPINVTLKNAGDPTNVVASSVTVDGKTINNVLIGPYTLTVNTYASSDPLAGQKYEEEAYLFSQIVKSGADRTAIQTAAWDIMAYGITDLSYTKAYSLSENSYIDAALANYSSMNGAGYAIISDTVKGGEQEFIVDPPNSVTPEPSPFALMLFPALLLGAEMMRRQKLTATLS